MERLLPASDDYRVDVEAVFVYQVVAGELRAQVAAAEDDVPPGLCLEGEHLGRHDGVGDRRAPADSFQGAGVDDLRHAPPYPREKPWTRWDALDRPEELHLQAGACHAPIREH